MNRWTRGVAVACLLPLFWACQAADIDDPTQDHPALVFIDEAAPLDLTVRSSAESAMQLSHPSVPLQYLFAALFITDFSAEQSGCPAKTDDSNEATGTIDQSYDAGIGGCTNDAGTPDPDDDQHFEGQITILGQEDDFRVQVSDFRASTPGDCMGTAYEAIVAMTGDVHATQAKMGSEVTYSVLMLFELSTASEPDCALETPTIGVSSTIDLAYSGADTDADGIPDETIDFSATNAMATSDLGGWQSSSLLEHSTLDEITAGEACYEPRQGVINVDAGDHSATLRADGASNCTADACAGWELDGTLQPDELCGVEACHVSPGTSRAPGWGGLVLALAALSFWRKRRRA